MECETFCKILFVLVYIVLSFTGIVLIKTLLQFIKDRPLIQQNIVSSLSCDALQNVIIITCTSYLLLFVIVMGWKNTIGDSAYALIG